jgi:NADH-quinone oxidoreductase subunit H
LSALFGGIGRLIYAVFAPIISRIPGLILISGVIFVCIAVFAHALLFDFADEKLISAPTNLAGESHQGLFGGPLTLQETKNGLEAAGVPAAGVVQYLSYPLQYPLVRDVVAMGGVIGFISLVPLFGIWWERKVAGRIQSRLGPMRVGGWHGWSQTIADGVKLLSKEDLCPKDADRPLFLLAPYLTFIPSVAAFLALPFGAMYVFRSLDVALVFILAMLGVEVVGVIIAGWASNNKWSVYGAMREACQMVSYEIPLGMALLIPVISVGSINLQVIGEYQSGGWVNWLAFKNPFLFGAFIAYYVASLASCKRAPFDLPESESELVAGFHTEYSGFRWSMFFFAEYAAMFVVSGLAVILFLGAWYSPLPTSWAFDESGQFGWLMRGVNGVLYNGPIWFITKGMLLFFLQLWIRWTLPRVRIDQVLYSCVQVILPLVMVMLLGSTLWTLYVDPIEILAKLVNWFLALIGAAAMIGAVGIAAYGYINNRKLVGYLAIDVKPGS